MTVFKPRKIIGDNKILADEDSRSIEELAERCLKSKWIKDQSKNLNRLLSPCAFCFEVKSNGNDCSKCQIPKVLCDEDGKNGFIGRISSKNGNVFLKDIDAKDYEMLRDALKDLMTKGKLSEKMKAIIEGFL